MLRESNSKRLPAPSKAIPPRAFAGIVIKTHSEKLAFIVSSDPRWLLTSTSKIKIFLISLLLSTEVIHLRE
jgi:hypothetical protein